MRIHPRSQAVGEFCAWINPTGRECPLRACLRRPVCVHRTGRGFGRQANASAYWFRAPRSKYENKLSGLSIYVARKKRRPWKRCGQMCKRGLFPVLLFCGCRGRKFSLHFFYHFMLLASGESGTGWYQATNDYILF